MAILRELITVVSFEVQGVNKVDAAIGQVKTSLLALGKLFGIAFGIEKLYEFGDELFSAAKEVAKLQYQLTRMARVGDDIPTAMTSLFDIAQATGIEYTHVLDTYREFLNESKESNVSQQQLLDTVSNIYKTMRLGAVSGDKMQEVLRAFNLGFRRGAIGLRQWGLIVDEAPDLVNALGASIGKTREEMQEMAKTGKLTADVIVKGLGKSLTTVNDEFAKRSGKIAESFTRAWNSSVRLATGIWKIVNANSVLTKVFDFFFGSFFRGIEKAIDFVGGLSNAISYLGYVAAVVVLPRMITLTWSLITAMRALTVAQALAFAKWTAITAGVLAAAAAIEDLVSWVGGKETIIGDYLGKYEDVMLFLNNKFNLTGLKDGFVTLQTYLSGEFTAFWTQLDLTKSFRELKDYVTKEFSTFWQDFSKGFGKPGQDIITINDALKVLIGYIKDAVKYLNQMATAANDAGKAVRRMLGLNPEPDKTLGDAGPYTANSFNMGEQLGNQFGRYLHDTILGWFNLGPKAIVGPTPIPVTPETPIPVTPIIPPSPPAPTSFMDTIRNMFPGAFFDKKLTPNVTPGQVTGAPSSGLYVGPGATNNNNQAVNQTNNVTIQLDPSLDITGKITGAVSDMWEAFGREAKNAMPITESATQ